MNDACTVRWYQEEVMMCPDTIIARVVYANGIGLTRGGDVCFDARDEKAVGEWKLC